MELPTHNYKKGMQLKNLVLLHQKQLVPSQQYVTITMLDFFYCGVYRKHKEAILKLVEFFGEFFLDAKNTFPFSQLHSSYTYLFSIVLCLMPL